MAGNFVTDLLTPVAKGEVRDLSDVIFKDTVDISNRRLGNLDLSRAVFEAPVIARGAIFTGLAWLRGATFRSTVDFASAIFCSDARFDSAHFTREAVFSGVEYRGIAAFDRATFAGAAFLDRMLCLANLSFDSAAFDNMVNA